MKKIILLIFSLFIFTANAGYCVIDAATGEDIKGYRGDLPDLTERFQRYVPQTARPQFKSVDAFNVSKGYKPVPRDNPTYVNVILKKEKVSAFANDIFHDDLQSIYQEQTLNRDELKAVSKTEFKSIVRKVH